MECSWGINREGGGERGPAVLLWGRYGATALLWGCDAAMGPQRCYGAVMLLWGRYGAMVLYGAAMGPL